MMLHEHGEVRQYYTMKKFGSLTHSYWPHKPSNRYKLIFPLPLLRKFFTSKDQQNFMKTGKIVPNTLPFDPSSFIQHLELISHFGTQSTSSPLLMVLKQLPALRSIDLCGFHIEQLSGTLQVVSNSSVQLSKLCISINFEKRRSSSDGHKWVNQSWTTFQQDLQPFACMLTQLEIVTLHHHQLCKSETETDYSEEQPGIFHLEGLESMEFPKCESLTLKGIELRTQQILLKRNWSVLKWTTIHTGGGFYFQTTTQDLVRHVPSCDVKWFTVRGSPNKLLL